MNIPEDAIGAVAHIFERAHGNQLGEYERAEVVIHNLEGCDPQLLADELQSAILNQSASYRARAYWALGKRFDPGLITFFRARLAIELQHDLGTVFQIMIALDNLGEPVFAASRKGSYSLHDSDLNRQDAESYLNNQGA